jgi:hypothetical protein
MQVERVHYNCVCDESVALLCSNTTCARELPPDDTLVVSADGSVFCSEACAGIAVGAVL